MNNALRAAIAGKRRLAGNKAPAASSNEVKQLHRETGALQEVAAELCRKTRLLKKACSGLARTTHENRAAEKLEILRLVKPLPVRYASLTRPNRPGSPSI
jgi:hypothetical protein